MKKILLLWLLFFPFLSVIAQQEENLDSLRINELQIIASHNSYRTRTHKPIYNWVRFFHWFIPKQYDSRGWDYTHLPLAEQFDNYNVRGIELDLYYDPKGGHYAKRQGNRLVFQAAKSKIAALNQPGFKIIHIPDVDYNTHYYTFVEALTSLKTWSDSHPNHLPIFVQIELKTSALGNYIPLKILPKAIPFTETAAIELDKEVKSVFGEDLAQVMTPDKLKGNFSSLNEVVQQHQLPTLAQTRGKIFFIIQGNEEVYLKTYPHLTGSSMFVYANPETPEAVFLIINDAKKHKTDIQNWVKKGYMIRTRCDSETTEARTGDTSTRDAAFESGAQILSTDYYKPDNRYKTSKKWKNYFVQFPNPAPIRKNVIQAEKKTLN